MSTLHTHYRPTDFDDVIGQDHAIKALKGIIGRDTSHAFLFAGPSGTGKTTLARIVAAKVGVQKANIMEFDASTNTGIEDIRTLQQLLQYRAHGGGSKAIIIDEAHGLSKQAWNALLKVTEEPPEFIYFFLCTTEPGKVPKNIKTRFSSFTLKPVSVRAMAELVEWVAKEEGVRLPSDIVALVCEEAEGSPRQALVNLAAVVDCKTEKEAAQVLQSAKAEADATIDFCRHVTQGGSWSKGVAIIDKLENANPESVRIVTLNYLSKVARGAKSDNAAIATLRKMEAFSVPYNSSDGKALLMLSLGRCLFAD